MFQNFDDPQTAANTDRLTDLRAAMRRAKIDAYVIPRADEFQGEYVPACAERLFWLTGFSGSAGNAVITQSKAALFVDGRYTVQAAMQVDTKIYEIVQQPPGKMTNWVAQALKKTPAATVGFDPWLVTMQQHAAMREVLQEQDIALKPSRENLVDLLWGEDRPTEPDSTIIAHPLKYSGERTADKVEKLQARLRADNEDAIVITLPETVSWLFNLRANDVPHTPVVRAYAIVPAKGQASIFTDRKRATSEAIKSLEQIARFKPASGFTATLKGLREKERTTRVAPASTPFAVERALTKRNLVEGKDPCIAWKAAKNSVEIKGSRSAHLRDGTAMCRFLAWLDTQAPSGTVTEISAARKLEAFRQETGALKEISFDTISGFGPNGAIVHYRVTASTNLPLKGNGLYLVDSGAQYADGTTDITRTIAIGKPTAEMKSAFTRVLKGHIAIATAMFPEGTRGVDIDAFARAPLWQAGLDYDHGTGHGVGSYLSVHEGPQGLSRRSMVKLEPGMILSNEPGYYKENAFGIRIENLILVRKPEIPTGGERKMLSFENLTLAPIDTRLIDRSLMSKKEIAWLNDYHADVRKQLNQHLSGADKAWLKQATESL